MHTFEQMSLFGPVFTEQKPSQKFFNLPGGEVTLFEGGFGAEKSDRIFRTLTHETPGNRATCPLRAKPFPSPG
jgi:hypothetical protein